MRWTPIAVSLSGTLDPFVLAVDGKGMETRSTPVTGLSVNSQPVKAEAGAHRPFFLAVDGDSLQIAVVVDKKEEKLPLWELPCLRGLEAEGPRLRLRFCPGTTIALWDGSLLQITRDEASVDADAAVASHVLEIGHRGMSRSYSVRVEAIVEEPPPPDRTYLALGLTPTEWKDRSFFHFIAGRQYSYRLSLHGYLEFGVPVYGILPRFAVGAQGGYQIWRTKTRVIFEMGLSVRAILRDVPSWEISYRQGGALSPLPDSKPGMDIGPYIRIEPFSLGNWRMVLNLQTDAFVHGRNGGGTLFLAEIGYVL